MKWIKKLFHNHTYTKKSERLIHAGMGKMIVYECQCGKEKVEFI